MISDYPFGKNVESPEYYYTQSNKRKKGITGEMKKREIKKVYKKQPRLSKFVVVYKPKLSFENAKT